MSKWFNSEAFHSIFTVQLMKSDEELYYHQRLDFFYLLDDYR